MSTHNRAAFNSTTIESALKHIQRFRIYYHERWGSRQTAMVLEKYAKLDPHLIILTNTPNLGLIVGLNKGSAHVRGKYIARINGVDKMLPERFEKQVAYRQEHSDGRILSFR